MMSQPASRLDQRLLHQHRDRFVVEDLAVAQQPVMAVAGVGIERDVGEEADVRHCLLDGAQRAADEIVRVERFAAVGVAQRRIGVGKERKAGMPSSAARSASRTASSTVSRSTPGIEATGTRALVAVDDEDRPDQVVGRQHVLAHQAARPFGLAVAARTNGRDRAWRSPRPRLPPGQTGACVPAGGRT